MTIDLSRVAALFRQYLGYGGIGTGVAPTGMPTAVRVALIIVGGAVQIAEHIVPSVPSANTTTTTTPGTATPA